MNSPINNEPLATIVCRDRDDKEIGRFALAARSFSNINFFKNMINEMGINIEDFKGEEYDFVCDSRVFEDFKDYHLNFMNPNEVIKDIIENREIPVGTIYENPSHISERKKEFFSRFSKEDIVRLGLLIEAANFCGSATLLQESMIIFNDYLLGVSPQEIAMILGIKPQATNAFMDKQFAKAKLQTEHFNKLKEMDKRCRIIVIDKE